MTILDSMARSGVQRGLKIFATDIDRTVLERASAGIYAASISSDVGPQRLQRYFRAEGDGYHIARHIRERIIFARHDLTRDAPFTRMHLITCRNVLIYLQPALQNRVLAMLHYALRPKGLLLLGAAETVGELEDEFETLDRKWKLFRKRRDTFIPLGDRREGTPAPIRATAPRRADAPATPPAPNLLHEAFVAFLADDRAASLVVGARHELLHAYGDVHRFLRMPEGRGTLDVGQLVQQLRQRFLVPLGRLRRAVVSHRQSRPPRVIRFQVLPDNHNQLVAGAPHELEPEPQTLRLFERRVPADDHPILVHDNRPAGPQLPQTCLDVLPVPIAVHPRVPWIQFRFHGRRRFTPWHYLRLPC
jgi:hypothetical protein